MIRETVGDIFQTRAVAVVIPVNCEGVMGKGLAFAAKTALKVQSKAYMAECKNRLCSPGSIYVHPGDLGGLDKVIFATTKDKWKDPSKLLWVEEIIDKLTVEIPRLGLPSVAVPALGCGAGGLAWPKVQMRMKVAFEKVPGVEWVLYAPPGQQYAR